MEPLVYFDYAATSAVRPPEVIDAVCSFLRDVGATPGRSAHRLSLSAGRIAFRCRSALAELFGIDGDPGRIAFHFNATHALNVALQGTLRSGDRVVRTPYDHNAVRRPIAALHERGVHETVLSGFPDGSIDLDEAEQALQGDGSPARLLVLPHASNVLGTTLPVRQLAERAHARGTLVLLDAAQTAGHFPLDVAELGIDLLAFTGHKGLLGPQGTGGLWVRDGVDVPPVLFGGTGADSLPPGMPRSLPDRLEAGTQNGPGLAGLLAGVEWIRERGIAALHREEQRLKERLLEKLGSIDTLGICSPRVADGVGIVTVTAEHLPPSTLARRLDREYGVLARSGLHCAPEAHAVLGTLETGALRLSLGWASRAAEVDRAAEALAAICAEAQPAFP